MKIAVLLTLLVACQTLEPYATPTPTIDWPGILGGARERDHSRQDPSTPKPTPTAAAYIWIPVYADPGMAERLVNSYLETVVTTCTGVMGGAWTPRDPGYWEAFDICAVNAQLGFRDPTGVATEGCVSDASECRRYELKR